MYIQILVDNPNSWIIPYVHKLENELFNLGHKVNVLTHSNQVKNGDVLCLLACEKIFKKLNLNKHNLVVHESALPYGKGWSPLTWQILEGKNEIPVTLFEATEKVDNGDIYLQEVIKLTGLELIDEIRSLQGETTIKLIKEFIVNNCNISGRKQVGDEFYYEKRKPSHSELDINKSIEQQFNLLRVVDNERYPAYFNYKGEKYKIIITKFDK